MLHVGATGINQPTNQPTYWSEIVVVYLSDEALNMRLFMVYFMTLSTLSITCSRRVE
jgi:hypothetical protein